MLVDVVAPLSTEQLELSVSADKWTIGRTIQHIAANRVWWFQLWMNEGDHELASIIQWDPSGVAEPPKLTASELVAGLTSSWDMIANALARWVPEDLEQVFSAPKVLSEEEQEMYGDATRQWIIWHVLEHEIHHGGEISLVLGKHGLKGIYGNA
jgi:uncharacterized damage-inducible protein DinB